MHNLVKQGTFEFKQDSSGSTTWKPTKTTTIKTAIDNDTNPLSNYGEDSLEIATVDDELFDQSDLAERISDAEKKFSTSSLNTSRFASEYFEHPALYRVLFMGSVTEEKKKELFKKLSQGFVHVIQQQQQLHQHHPRSKNLSLLGQPIIPFKEIKHNILLLSDEDDPNLISDICEDIGVSMIEADFTWNSNAVNYSNDPNNLLLQYAWNQCPNPRDLPTAWLENQIFTSSKSRFTGYMQPETTPNGIDLCVYFYDGLLNKEDESRTKDDLQLLCLLRKLGIYVLPLTTTRDESVKSHFADLLTQFKVRCLDLGNLEVGQEPSFFHKVHHENIATQAADRLSRLQGMECTQLNVPRVATYQILAVDQFCGIENNAIFQLLKRTRERQVIRDEIKVELQRKKQQQQERPSYNDTATTTTATATDMDDDDDEDDDDIDPLENSLDSIGSIPMTINNHSKASHTSNSVKVDDSRSSRFQWVALLSILLVSLYALSNGYLINTTHTTTTPTKSVEQWTASFQVDLSQPEMSFTLLTRDERGTTKWSKVTPTVWLNHAFNIPIEKVKGSPGKYQLLFDPFTMIPHDDSNKYVSLMFHVNSSSSSSSSNNDNSSSNQTSVSDKDDLVTFITQDPSGATYVLLNHYYKPPAPTPTTTIVKTETSPSIMQEQHYQAAENKENVLERTWKTIVFITNNYSNLYKIIIKN